MQTKWIKATEGNPPPLKPVLLVTIDYVMQSIGKPCLAVDVGYYKPEEDIYTLVTDELIRGGVFFWADLPDVPWDLVEKLNHE